MVEREIREYSCDREKQEKGLFASLFILQTQLQTAFDKADGEMTLKQFMLLVMTRRALLRGECPTFTDLGRTLGCSRQNVKKLAALLQKNGFAEIMQSNQDARACTLALTEKAEVYLERQAPRNRQMLNRLFADYTDAELTRFYNLMMKLYQGTSRIEAEGGEDT